MASFREERETVNFNRKIGSNYFVDFHPPGDNVNERCNKKAMLSQGNRAMPL